jgi:ferric-dicitrate binding protein FerR (iron transport regulator)
MALEPADDRLAAYEAGELPEAEARQVRAELAASPRARGVVARLRTLRALLPALRRPTLADPFHRALAEHLEAAAAAQQRWRRVRRSALAAGAVALGAAALAFVLRPQPPPETVGSTRLRTGSGDFQLLPLGDRGVAFVSEDTDVELRPAGGAALRIHSGSVRLVIRRRVTQPFVVATPAADVEVLGTEFDVTVVGESTAVKVVRGEVEVRNERGRRRLWAREAARVRPGEEPQMAPPPSGSVTGGPAEILQGKEL